MMWKLRSPNDLEARTSRGGAHKLQLEQGGVFLPSKAFSLGEEVFADEVFPWKRTIVVINFLNLQLVMKYMLLNQPIRNMIIMNMKHIQHWKGSITPTPSDFGNWCQMGVLKSSV